MQKHKQLILSFLFVSLFISCGKQKEEKQVHSESAKKVEHKHEAENNLRLNNGELWSANLETTQGIENMIALMHSFSDKESVEAYHTLKTNLDNEFGTILKKCTMKGESHDQLHNFLLPMQEMFEGMTSTDLHTCKQNFNTLNNHLKEYPKYFK